MGHLGCELLIAGFVAFSLAFFRNASDSAFLWHFVAVPSISLVIAVIFDHKILMELEKNLPSSTHLGSSTSQPPTSSKGSDSTVNININSNNSQEDDKPQESSSTDIDESAFEHMQESSVNDVYFPEHVVAEINALKDIQKNHEKSIQSLKGTCDDIAKMVSELQSAEVHRYGVNLKKKIYNCLGKGYATPQEYEEIEVEYEIYHDILHGNGKIQRLHDNKFAKLHVRDDAVMQVQNEDRSNIIPLCRYGEFDKEDKDDKQD
jgi:hypothetical protein